MVGTLFNGCGTDAKKIDNTLAGHEIVEEVQNEYAEGFQITKYDDGCALIIIDGIRYFVSEGCPQVRKESDDDSNAVWIRKKPSCVYNASSSAMDLIRAAGALDFVKATSTKEEDWAIDEVRKLVSNGTISFVGKYNAPDYESLVSMGADLAIENTMSTHSPEVKEQLEKLGIPVLVERSSYESHPLARLEWIKVYGLIFGKEKEAEDYYKKQVEIVSNLDVSNTEKKTVVYFFVTSNGAANVRKSGDYIPKMIEMAGGEYALKDAAGDDNALSTMNMDFETFYSSAKDADILIYNSSIEGELRNMEDLIAKNSLFKDFKAVQNGQVWCTSESVFQQSTAIPELIMDFNAVICGRTELHLLKQLD